MNDFTEFLQHFAQRFARACHEFIITHPRFKNLIKGFLARVPFLQPLRTEVQNFATAQGTLSRLGKKDALADNHSRSSPFFYYNSIFDPESLIRKQAPGSVAPNNNYATNFLGLLIDPKVFPSHLNNEVGKVEGIPIPANWHADIAEWGAAFRSVEFSKSNFTIIEVGCGWGCWMNNMGLAAKRKGFNLNLIGIEGDLGHVRFAEEILALNGFRQSDYKLYRGIAAATNGFAFFPKASDSGEAYGLEPVFCHNELDVERLRGSNLYEELPMISLDELSKDCERVDLLHIDIQGGEVDFVKDCIGLLSKKVAYTVIGTHSREIEGHLFRLLLDAGWLLEIERPAILSLDPVPHVTVDGVQGWRNLELLPKTLFE